MFATFGQLLEEKERCTTVVSIQAVPFKIFTVELMKKKVFTILGILLLLGLLSALFYHATISYFPRATHAWSQSDRYALSLNFQNNGFDFFHPETYILNLPIPPKNPLTEERGITRVDFPIHDYIVSLLMEITGSNEPRVFRAYILLYSLIGLFFLFLLTRKLTSSLPASVFIIVFAFTAPVYTFYQDGFLPSIPSIANTFIAYYFYIRYRETRRLQILIFSLFFFTLAALARTPLIILLVAIFIQHIISYILSRKIQIKEIIAFLCSFLIIGGYFLYNIHLGNLYGSGFLSNPMPPSSWADALYIIKTIKQNWIFEYFTLWHYLFIGLLLIFYFVMIFVKKQKKVLINEYWVQLVIAFGGAFIYFILMMTQFPNHDYYFLDTFFPLILIAVVLLFTSLPALKRVYQRFLISILIIFSILFIFRSIDVQVKRYAFDPYNQIEASITDYANASAFFDSLGISPESHILVLNSYTPNIPLIRMNRKGYFLYNAKPGEITEYFNRNWDYAVVQEKMPVSDLIKKDSCFINNLIRIGGNGYISVYKRSALKQNQSIEQFLNLNDSLALSRESISFDIDSLSATKPYASLLTNEEYRSPPRCARMTINDEFLELINNPAPCANNITASRFLVSFWLRLSEWKPDQGAELILTLSNKNGGYIYSPFRLGEYVDPKNTYWQQMVFQFNLPAAPDLQDMIKIYIWNTGKNVFYIDDVTITIGH